MSGSRAGQVAPERQPDGRLTADILKECAETLKQGKTYQHQALMGHTMNTNKPLYVDMYWVPVKYRGDDALLCLSRGRERSGPRCQRSAAAKPENRAKFRGDDWRSRAISGHDGRRDADRIPGISTTAKDASAQADQCFGTVEQASSNVQIVAAAVRSCPPLSLKLGAR